MPWLFEECPTSTSYSKNTYEHNLLRGRSAIDRHQWHMAPTFGIFVDKDNNEDPSLN